MGSPRISLSALSVVVPPQGLRELQRPSAPLFRLFFSERC